jgi:sulfate-transporting ATPase
VIAGVGGVALAFQGYNIQYDMFNATGSIAIVTLAVVGGIGYVTGALLGSMLAVGGIGTLISRAIFGSNADNWLALLGGVFVIVILLQDPNGLASQYSRGIRRVMDRVRKPKPAQSLPGRPLETDRRAAATLEVRDVSVHFGGVVALDGASLKVEPGKILGLIGPNGAGKTTLVDAVTGFNRPNSGDILIDGRSIAGWSPHRRARRGLVRSFQSLELFDDLTVFENLHTASDSHSARSYLGAVLPHREQELPPVAIEAIHDLGLGDDLNRRAEELPYGRRRLLAIARTLAADPAVLLLDEPAAGLDTVESAELGRLLRVIVEKTNVGVLLVEHEMPLVMSLCDSIVVLNFGKVIASGTPDQVRNDPEVVVAYLGTGQAGHEAEPAKRAASSATLAEEGGLR